jgi:hypothetical protein
MRTLKAKLAADAVIQKGALCGFLGGYLYAWDTVEGLSHPCIAIPARGTSVDNTGGNDGDLECDVDFGYEKLFYPFANDDGAPLTQADIGGTAYGLDDQTVTADPTGASPLGTPWVISDGSGTNLRAGVYVELPAGALAATIASLLASAASAANAPTMQAVNATLASGTITINTGITVAANSEVIAYPKGAITGSTNFGCVRELVASRVAGAPGVGTLVIEAVGNNGALDSDAAGAIRVVILTPQN